jgi:uncharacterized protein DUF1579
MRRCLIVMLLCVSASASAQTDGRDAQFKDPLLDNLVGRWDVPGHVRGRDVKSRLTAEWVLNHQFLQLKLEDTANPSQYEAWIFIGYDFLSERYVVHWIDVFGGRFSETLGYGSRMGDAIRVVFEYGDGPFRNTLAWTAREKSWHWLIESKDQAGRWKTFAEYDLHASPLAARSGGRDGRSPR